MELPLTFKNGIKLKIEEDRIKEAKEDLEIFQENNPEFNTLDTATGVMFSYELKANNQVEGYKDDVSTVIDLINNEKVPSNKMQKRRILNLYKGYNYLLNHQDINKDGLKELYNILSKGLLSESDLQRMGKYYREDRVYILLSGLLDRTPDEGIEYTKIDEFMDKYFSFLNNYVYGNASATDEYIKSQILHFYFVYIHPYFDVNGRTSRTLAMWYLLNKKAYSYIIFNRGIVFKGSTYDKVIVEAKKYGNITYFIKYMLDTVLEELEKEYIINHIKNSINTPLSSKDYQTLLYLLSMNGLLSVKDFASIYNYYNDKKSIEEVYRTMLDPLLQKHILEVERITKTYMFNNYHNEILRFNPRLLDYDKEQIKKLTRYK